MPFEQLHDKSHASILLVEDNREIREALKILLEIEGYLVFVAENGREALAKLDKLKPEEKPILILTDMMMPEMSGLEMIKLLKSDHTLITIPLAIMTASDERVPGIKIIKKPFNIDIVIRLAHDACKKHHGLPQDTFLTSHDLAKKK